MNSVPQVSIGSIGGSGTWGAKIPEVLDRPDVRLLKRVGPFETPYGPSAVFKLLEVAGQLVLRTTFHGFQKGVPIITCCKQVAHVYMEAGVQWALVDASVGGIVNPDDPSKRLPPWSVTATDDFMQFWPSLDDTPPFTTTNGNNNWRVRDPFCASLRRSLVTAAQKQPMFEVFDHGVYLCTAMGRAETQAEIRVMQAQGAHIVGQTLGHEAPLYRMLGVHLASLNIVSNHAEGFDGENGEALWVGDHPGAMSDLYRECPIPMANALFDAMIEVIENGGPKDCKCLDYVMTGAESQLLDE